MLTEMEVSRAFVYKLVSTSDASQSISLKKFSELRDTCDYCLHVQVIVNCFRITQYLEESRKSFFHNVDKRGLNMQVMKGFCFLISSFFCFSVCLFLCFFVCLFVFCLCVSNELQKKQKTFAKNKRRAFLIVLTLLTWDKYLITGFLKFPKICSNE